jgi:competence protein ComEC
MIVGASGLLSFGALACFAIICGLLALLFWKDKRSSMLVFACTALVSACRFFVGSCMISGSAVDGLKPQLPIPDIRLVGRVNGMPRFYAYRSGGLGSWVVPFRCEGTDASGQWRRCRGRIAVRVVGAAPDLQFNYGERILFSGELRENTFPGGESINLDVRANEGWKKVSGTRRFSWMAFGQRWREKGATRLSYGIEKYKAQLSVYKALLLGYRETVSPGINVLFSRTGTMHIFAISGLHVGMVALFLAIVLKVFGIPRNRQGVWLIPLLFMYVASTGMKSSAVRAFIMAGIYFLAPLFRRKPDIPNAVAFAAILLLLIKPVEILSVGFIYSFVVVSFIVMAFSVVPRHVVVWGTEWWRRGLGYVVSLGITTLAAFVASAPLSALYFEQFSPISLLCNMVVVPLAFCIVLCGWLSISLPFASEIFNYAGLFFIDLLLSSTEWFASLPGACFRVSAPSLVAVLFWYVGWIMLLIHFKQRRSRFMAVGLVLLSMVLAVAGVFP